MVLLSFFFCLVVSVVVLLLSCCLFVWFFAPPLCWGASVEMMPQLSTKTQDDSSPDYWVAVEELNLSYHNGYI